MRRTAHLVVAAAAFAAAWSSPTTPQETAPSARELLDAAEAAYAGSPGAIDEERAGALFAQAAATGDPLARMRVATLRHLARLGFERDRRTADEEARGAAPAVRRAAAQGDAEAQFLLGAQALFGLGRGRDDAEAAEWFALAADQGHLWALHNLAWMIEHGRGSEPDLERATALYRKAAEGGSAWSMSELGRILVFEEPQRAEEGLLWLRRATERRVRTAENMLGSILLYGKGAIRPNYEEASVVLLRAANAGSLSARNDLAYARLFGLGGEPDRDAARSWFERAAELGDPWSMIELGWLTIVDQTSAADGRAGWAWVDRAAASGYDGFSTLAGFRNQEPREVAVVLRDLERLERLATSGSPTAQALLARVAYEGSSPRGRDHEAALRWARAAAAAGEPHAMRTLAHALRHGNGVDPDPEEAVRWLRRCADLDESFCAMRLSQELRDGHVVPRDLDASLRWLERSAEIGNYWSMVDLGNLYAEGWNGRPVDLERATYWKKRTAELGHSESIGWLRVHAPDEVP